MLQEVLLGYNCTIFAYGETKIIIGQVTDPHPRLALEKPTLWRGN
jgi:hypothetical protein